MHDNHIPLVILGGGIIGLTIANELLENGFKDFCILDQAQYLGDHSSGRNSGVMHAGLYYPKDSLKRKFCIEGLSLWKDFCKKHNLFHKNCGKYIFTTKENKSSLLELFERAKSNGVDVRLASNEEIRTISEFANAELAFFSPNTSVIDPSECISFFKNHLEKNDIPILLNQNIEKLEVVDGGFLIQVNGEEIHTEKLINACGLGAVDVREKLGLKNIQNKLVKGHYVRSQIPFFNNSLLYPIPLKNLKGLGVHTCIDSDGSIKFGPDAQDTDSVDYSLNSENIELLKNEVLQNFKITRDKLTEDYVGVRSKIIKDGELYTDFYIGDDSEHGIKNYIELLGIESPGFTSSLALAKFISNLIV